jgi:hypothetical protein
MKESVFQNKNYSIYRVGKESLPNMAEFVVKENYKHHIVSKPVENIKKEIETVYQEELSFTNRSQIYIAENEHKRMIGCIRVMRWNLTATLPIQKIFNIMWRYKILF